MKFITPLLVLVSLLLLMGCTSTEEDVQNTPETPEESSDSSQTNPPEPQVETKEPITIVAYGDSLTEGLGVERENAYPAQLERALQEQGHNVHVINAGISGETSQGAASRVEWVLTLNPDIVILVTGGNDGLRGIDPFVMQENIESIVQQLQQENVKVVLGGMITLQNLGPQYNEEYEAVFSTLAQKYDTAFIPFFLEGVAANTELNQDDQIHPTQEGYRVIVENNVLPVIESILQ